VATIASVNLLLPLLAYNTGICQRALQAFWALLALFRMTRDIWSLVFRQSEYRIWYDFMMWGYGTL